MVLRSSCKTYSLFNSMAYSRYHTAACCQNIQNTRFMSCELVHFVKVVLVSSANSSSDLCSVCVTSCSQTSKAKGRVPGSFGPLANWTRYDTEMFKFLTWDDPQSELPSLHSTDARPVQRGNRRSVPTTVTRDSFRLGFHKSNSAAIQVVFLS